MNLAWINLEIYEYNSDLDAILLSAPDSSVSSPSSTPPPNICTCAGYLDVSIKTKATCKQATNEEKKTILKKRAKEIIELLHYVKFAPCGFKLDC